MVDLYRHSIEVILRNQAPTGAYLASPTFDQYVYSWLRDGSFIAHAMDRAGQRESAGNFFRWVNLTLLKHAHKVDEIERGMAQGRPLDEIDFLHTRYTVEGDEVTADSSWGNFQPDGYGTWLWALAEYVRGTGDYALFNEVREGVALTVRYLSAVWRLPTYDCWEEHPEYIHPYTLGAIYAGLRAAARLAEDVIGRGQGVTAPFKQASVQAGEVRRFILEYGVCSGRVAKHIAPGKNSRAPQGIESAGVDASLVGLCTPYGVFSADDPLFRATLAQIDHDLHRPGRGVYRYLEDTYYGGGEWVLLAAWLGWHYAASGQPERAKTLLDWACAQADDQGNLPEQVSGRLLAPDYLKTWQASWGKAASPLLWSHAMVLILADKLEEK
ncbi:MAG: glycoside hydrolase family 15 protein [Chloroflexi bacterium]|nr:glycoside hydrolase family 15 protein [Chloroflexota bacterium]